MSVLYFVLFLSVTHDVICVCTEIKIYSYEKAQKLLPSELLLGSDMHQIVCPPDPTGGAYSAPPNPLAGLGVGPPQERKGGRGGEKEGEEGKRREGSGGRGGERGEGRGGEGRESRNAQIQSWQAY